MPDSYTTLERARMRASAIAPESTLSEFLTRAVPDPIARRNLNERLRKGNPRTLKVLEQLSKIFETHFLYWLEEDPETVRELASGNKVVSYSSPGATEQLASLLEALDPFLTMSVTELPAEIAISVLKVCNVLKVAA